ncbi:hypothetical protein [Vibrio taketomensis]|uniref:hypothetical protein n=1 Tax=Vibrio taketomensis TaxID=2572923 RepID=UPI001E2D229C|nr:hypothetical protein [Vibrio taketomensis]
MSNSDESNSPGKWTGMPSPIEQAKLQSQLLKSLLNENAKSLLGKVAFIQEYLAVVVGISYVLLQTMH